MSNDNKLDISKVGSYGLIIFLVLVWVVVIILGFYATTEIEPKIIINNVKGGSLPGLNLMPSIQKKAELSFQNFSPYGNQTMNNNLINVNNRESEYPLQEQFYNFTTQKESPMNSIRPIP